MDKELHDFISRELDARLKRDGRKVACPMCGNLQFVLGDGAHINLLQDNIDVMQLSGQNIPALFMICTNCGFMSQHAIGALMPLDKWRELAKAAAERKKSQEAAAQPEAKSDGDAAAAKEERHG